ncbi:MAG: hypothetical protein NTNFB02_23360 [Nitrospira sp.]
MLREFLAPFEEIVFGHEGLHSTILSLPDLLDARKAPPEFLSWLSSWMGTTLYRRLSEDKQREFVANAADYYRYRGTLHNVQRLLKLFTGFEVQVEEPDFPMFQVGLNSTIGGGTYIEGGPPYAFAVIVKVPQITRSGDDEGRSREDRIQRLAREVIDHEKPAHTTYDLQLLPGSDTAMV